MKPMKRHGLVLLKAACGFLAACAIPDVGEGTFLCGSDAECADGYVCSGAGRCVPTGSSELPDAGAAPDASVPDGGSTGDGGTGGCTAQAECGTGRYCDDSATCSACSPTDALHCGTAASPAGCTACPSMTPACSAGVCKCTSDDSCGAASYCSAGSCLPRFATASAAPGSLAFGTTFTGHVSPPRSVTITNEGNADLIVSQATAADPFAVSENGCTAPVAPAHTCTLSVTFLPTASGAGNGSLVVSSNASGGDVTVGLSGTGLPSAPIASLSAESVSFGSLAFGTTSGARTVTLSNVGQAALGIQSIEAQGDFAQTNDCGASVAEGASCTLTIVFAPTVLGPRAGTITLADNASGSPRTVTLSGVGTGATADRSPSYLTFPSTYTGYMSPVQTVTITNHGNANLTIDIAFASDPFVIADNGCTLDVAPGGSCTLGIVFRPTSAGIQTGSLTVSSNSVNGDTSVSLSGTAVLSIPVASVSPPTLSFGSLSYGGSSPARAVTLLNTGKAAMSIAGISIAAGADDFAQTDDCPASLDPSASCTILVTFTPSALFARMGMLSVEDDAAGSPHTVSLTGTGTGAAATLSTTSLDFGTGTYTAHTSNPRTVTLTNAGNTALTVNVPTITGHFSLVSNLCTAAVAPTGTCDISVAFAPVSAGSQTGTLALTTGAAIGSSLSVSLAGTALLSVPGMQFSVPSLDLGTRDCGTIGPPSTVTLTNSGQATLTIASVATGSAEFAVTHNCPASLAEGANCTLQITFSPSQPGARSAILSVADNAAGSPHTVSLTGTGRGAMIAASPSSLSFPETYTDHVSEAQQVTLTNTGNQDLDIVKFNAVPPFQITDNTCFATIPASGSCSFSVTFAPAFEGTLTEVVGIDSNAVSSRIELPLMGVAVQSRAVAHWSMDALTFPPRKVGTPSPAQYLTLTNQGQAPLAVAIFHSGDFAAAGDCSTPLPPGGECLVEVTFTPTAMGTCAGSVSVADDTPQSPRGVHLTGQGNAGVPGASPSTLTFSTPVGSTSAAQTVTIANGGNAPLSVTGATASMGFLVSTSACTSALQPGETCPISVQFIANEIGQYGGDLYISTDGIPSSLTVTLSATATGATLNLSTTSLSFTTLYTGDVSPERVVTLTNGGNALLEITSLTPPAGFVVSSNFCGSKVDPGKGCNLGITFRPTVAGDLSGPLVIASNAIGGTATIMLSGIALASAPLAQLTMASSAFGNVRVGRSAAADAILRNTGNLTLSIQSIGVPEGFSQTNTCGTSVAGGAQCTFSVTFAPQRTGDFGGSLAVSDNASGSPHTVTLSGTGVQGTLTLDKSALDFLGPVGQGTTKNLVVSNTGNGPLTVGVDPVASPFGVSSGCPDTMLPNTTCGVSVTFTPQDIVAHTATLTITSDGSPSSASVTLTGTGQGAIASATSGSPVAFGTKTLGSGTSTSSVMLQNSGNITLTYTTSLSGSSMYSIATGGSGTVAAGANTSIAVAFTPTSAGQQDATLTISSDAFQGGSIPVSISATAVYPPPTVSGVSPNIVSTSGGTTITIQGTGFRSGNTVNVGGACTDVVVISSSQITCVLPAQASPGLVSLFVLAQEGNGYLSNALVCYAPAVVHAGTTTADASQRYQYSPLSGGHINANWVGQSWVVNYRVGIGTSPGGTETLPWTSLGNNTTFPCGGCAVQNLSLQPASTGVRYYITVRYQLGTGIVVVSGTSGPVGIAEAQSWDGVTTTGLVNTPSVGGYTTNFPLGSGVNVFYGTHYFETVTIASGTTVRVQPFGAAEGIGGGIDPTYVNVTSPKDGWLRLYANSITVSGTIDASGRGYGGGPGAGASAGLPGAGGLSGGGGTVWGGNGRGAAGGGGSTLAGGSGGYVGGGGGGATTLAAGVSGNGAGGGGGGGTMGGASPRGGGPGGYASGGCDLSGSQGQQGGGGGSGYGAGGGGGTNPSGGAGGGGAGGTGGRIAAGLGSGVFGGVSGAMGSDTGGRAGGYGQAGTNVDSSTDTSLLLGSGGGGGGNNNGEAGGGGGGAGGGAIYLVADSVSVLSGANLYTMGAPGGGGGVSWVASAGSGGGGGGGGGVLLDAATLSIDPAAIIDLRGGTDGTSSSGSTDGIEWCSLSGGGGGDGGSSTVTGGTLKLFYSTFSGTKPLSKAGRTYDPGPGHYLP